MGNRDVGIWERVRGDRREGRWVARVGSTGPWGPISAMPKSSASSRDEFMTEKDF